MDAIAGRSPDALKAQAVDGQTPREGDVVVVHRRSDGGYGVRRIPGTIQFSMPERERALGFARDFARRHAVDLWSYTEHDGTYRLLEAFRRESGQPAAGRGPRR